MDQAQSFFSTLNTKLEPSLQAHMKNVYASLALSTLSAAVGAYVHVVLRLASGGLMSALGSIGFLLALMGTPDNGKNAKLRLGYLMAFTFLSGMGLGPILDHVIYFTMEPALIPTAFFSTCLVFACFTLAAMLSNQRQYIYLGGTLMSLMSVMMIGAFLNIFLGSYILFKAQIYIGLFVMCGFVLYDTQVIMEKRRNGDKDYVMHAISLFMDFIQIFRYLLIILADKDSNKKKKK